MTSEQRPTVLGGRVACATQGRLLVRVGEEGKAAAMAQGAQPMVMNGRQMKGFVVVAEQLNARIVGSWVRRAQAFVTTLPAKASRAKPRQKGRSVGAPR